MDNYGGDGFLARSNAYRRNILAKLNVDNAIEAIHSY